MGYINHYDLQDIQLTNFKLCLQKVWRKIKNFVNIIGEYDLYRGTKWDDY